MHALLSWPMLFVPTVLLVGSSALAQTITEFPVPTPDADLHGMTVGPDGALWFNEPAVQKIGRITLDGAITEFPVPEASFNIAIGPDGNLWFTPYGAIGRLTPAGAVTMFPPPAGIDPTEFSTWDIVRGPDGAMWFTVAQGSIGRITMQGMMTLFPLPEEGQVYGLAFGPDGNLWYSDTERSVLGRMTTSGAVTEFPGGAFFDFTIGPDGQLWGSGNRGVGRISMSGAVEYFDNEAYRTIATGPDGHLWLAYSPTAIARMTTSGQLTAYAIPTSVHTYLGDGAFPFAVVTGPDGNIWFTEEFGNKIGRLELQGLLCAPDAHTLCLNGARFSVTASWKRTPEGASMLAEAVPLTADAGYFWFLAPDNVELIVKVLRACSDPFQSYWVFAAGLTNLGVDIVVNDRQTGGSKTYSNPPGTPFAPIQDTSAFATCP